MLSTFNPKQEATTQTLWKKMATHTSSAGYK